MLIGITGTDGSGKGETIWEIVARGCQIFFEVTKKNIDNLNSVCRTPVPNKILPGYNNVFLC